jgi:hypothetical protein
MVTEFEQICTVAKLPVSPSSQRIPVPRKFDQTSASGRIAQNGPGVIEQRTFNGRILWVCPSERAQIPQYYYSVSKEKMYQESFDCWSKSRKHEVTSSALSIGKRSHKISLETATNARTSGILCSFGGADKMLVRVRRTNGIAQRP